MKRQEIVDLDWDEIDKMNLETLRKTVSKASFVANTYLRRARNIGYTSPGLEHALERSKKLNRDFSSDLNKNNKLDNVSYMNKLRAELKDIKLFLDNKTITEKAANEFYLTTLDVLKERINMDNVKQFLGGTELFDPTKEELQNFWTAYHKFLEDKNSENVRGYGSQVIQEYVFAMSIKHGFSDDDYFKELLAEEKKTYNFKQGKKDAKKQSPLNI